MLELPEAVVMAAQINQALKGKTIRRAQANHTPHKFAWYSGDPANYNALLAEKTIGEASSYGGHIEIKADDMVLVLSLGLRCHAAGEKPPAKHQLLLEFSDGAAASATVQMWGGLFCYKEGEAGGYPDAAIARQRPSPLSDQFDRAVFDGLLTEECGKLSAKAFLATGQRIPGLGNGVLQDILWTAHVHPKRKMATLAAGDLETLYGAVKTVLAEMAAKGGRDTERDLFGRAGGYVTILSKNTAHRPCPACGMLIQKEAYLGGAIYFCARCQPLNG